MLIIIIIIDLKGVGHVGGGGEVSLCHFSQDRLEGGCLQYIVTDFLG